MKPINLNKARKTRAKAEAKKRAEHNSARFGRSKAQKIEETKTNKSRENFLIGHKLERDPSER